MSANSDKRMSIWTFLAPHDSDCDIFNAEISKWISAVVDKEISSDLVAELKDGVILCELFSILCPESELGRYNKKATLDLWKRDNIQIFANATVKYGVPRSAKLNYTFFESNNNASIITSILVFVKVLLEKKSPEEIKLPDSFLHSICREYLEKRIIHNSGSGEPILSLPPESAPESAPESVPSEEREAVDPTTPPSMEMSAEEIRQLDEMMRNQVNEMLQDILAERRRTTGLWDEEIDGKQDIKSVITEETDSEDSFEEKYVRSSGETEKVTNRAVMEDELYADSGEEEEKTLKSDKEKTEDVKIGEKEGVAIVNNSKAESTLEHHSPFQHADANVMEMMMQQPFDDFFSEDEEKESSVVMKNELKDTKWYSQTTESIEPVSHTNEVSQTLDASETIQSTTSDESKPVITTEPGKLSEEEFQKEKPSEEESQKEKPSSGFWWKTSLLAVAVATVVLAKRFHH